MQRILAVVAVLPLLASPAYAACTAPTAPACTAVSGPFADAADTAACRSAIDQFRSTTQAYTACRTSDLKAALDKVVAQSRRRPGAADYKAQVNKLSDEAERDGEAAIARYNAAAAAFRSRYVAGVQLPSAT